MKCDYGGSGVYEWDEQSGVTSEIQRILFDRLTNSVLSLRNLEEVNSVEIESTRFDGVNGCDHLINNKREVTLITDGLPAESCVSCHLLYG